MRRLSAWLHTHKSARSSSCAIYPHFFSALWGLFTRAGAPLNSLPDAWVAHGRLILGYSVDLQPAAPSSPLPLAATDGIPKPYKTATSCPDLGHIRPLQHLWCFLLALLCVWINFKYSTKMPTMDSAGGAVPEGPPELGLPQDKSPFCDQALKNHILKGHNVRKKHGINSDRMRGWYEKVYRRGQHHAVPLSLFPVYPQQQGPSDLADPPRPDPPGQAAVGAAGAVSVAPATQPPSQSTRHPGKAKASRSSLQKKLEATFKGAKLEPFCDQALKNHILKGHNVRKKHGINSDRMRGWYEKVYRRGQHHAVPLSLFPVYPQQQGPSDLADPPRPDPPGQAAVGAAGAVSVAPATQPPSQSTRHPGKAKASRSRLQDEAGDHFR